MTGPHSRGKLVTVFGGSGFVGRYVVRALAKRGWRVRIAVRRPDLAGHLQPLGAVGQIHAVQANVRYRETVLRAAEGSEAIVNLVAILSEGGAQTFPAVHAFGAKAIATSAAELGISNLVHVSAIGADADSGSEYATTKAEGEASMLEAVPGAVIVRPSIIFGPEDAFFNRFAAMAELSPLVPVISGDSKFQPVFVGDVAEVIARGVDGDLEPGSIYEIGGPQVKTFRECLEFMLEIIHRKRRIVSVPMPLARIQAAVLQNLPNPPLTIDQLKLLAHDNVVSDDAIKAGRTLEGLGIDGRTMAAVLPTYLNRFRPNGEFNRNRKTA